MAEILDEFDEATPLRNRFCSTLTVKEYEDQSANSTEEAIAELIAHLESNPQKYKEILRAKKRDETTESSVFSYIKVKFWSYFTGDDGCAVSDDECLQQLEKLKENMIKSYNYSQESRGRRFSKRLLDKRAQREVEKMSTPQRGLGSIPPPPLPPPLPPSLGPTKKPSKAPKPPSATPIAHAALTRRPLSQRPVKQAVKRKLHPTEDTRQSFLKQIKGSECKKKLKKVVKKSPDASTSHKDSDFIPFFNTKLLSKFKNAQSPISSPTLASPGSFESPIATPPPAPRSKQITRSGPCSKRKTMSGYHAKNQENVEPMELQ